MISLRSILVAGTLLIGSATLASANPLLRPHDEAKPVTHSAKLVGHEEPSASVNRVRSSIPSQPSVVQRVAVLERSAACDSLLCPGYAMLGVGF